MQEHLLAHLSPHLSPYLSIGRVVRDDAMPRSFYWEALIKAFEAETNLLSGCVASPDHQPADFFITYEDMVCEWNWPKHATKDANYESNNGETNFIRGHSRLTGVREAWGKDGLLIRYVEQLIQWAHRHPQHKLWILNMHPWYDLSQYLRDFPNIYHAKACLATHELSLMHNIISFPAPPIHQGSGVFDPSERPVTASFQGVNTHSCREAIAQLNDDQKFIIKLYDFSRHSQFQLTHEGDNPNQQDQSYIDLMQRSNFALVPRGDALYSYRLLEAMSYNTIPVIISDGWVLPFHRTVPWHLFSIHVPSDRVSYLPTILKRYRHQDIITMRQQLAFWYEQAFASLNCFIRQNFKEIAEIKK